MITVSRVDCTTFDAYEDETSTESSLMIKQTGALALSSMTYVLRSLTPNAQGIFRLLANFQLECGADFQVTSLHNYTPPCSLIYYPLFSYSEILSPFLSYSNLFSLPVLSLQTLVSFSFTH